MIAIFQTLVDLFGYPGDNLQDWWALHEKSKDILNSEERAQVERWLKQWPASPVLQDTLSMLNPNSPYR